MVGLQIRRGSAAAWIARRAFVLLASLACGAAAAQVAETSPAWLPPDFRYKITMWPASQPDPGVPSPAQLLGYELGDRPASHAEIERCFAAWAEKGLLELREYGRTHEGRRLFYAILTSRENREKLESIREDVGKLADPRLLPDGTRDDDFVRGLPAIAWLAYGIHGDETSGSDAAIGVAYRLLAFDDEEARSLLANLVVVIDPLQNPDGRDRFIRQMDEFRGYTPSLDMSALPHTGRWPSGRTNHYFFDLNRDWVYGTQPETRARWKVVAEWNPQLFVDSHEMWPDSTFMSNPAREPFNPNLAPLIRNWWKTFADDSGRAFDAYGWSYYTREWADFWYPGYSDAWASYHGAIGMLYEQAGIGGHAIRQSTGRVLTYHEAVHHQLVATLANLRTLRDRRADVLKDYLTQKRAGLSAAPASAARTFLLPPSENGARRQAMIDLIHEQGVEAFVAQQPFSAAALVGAFRDRHERREFPAGTLVVRRQQPRAALVSALLDFDPRMSPEFLRDERRDLEVRGESRIYDVTGWAPPLAMGVDAYWSGDDVSAGLAPYVPAVAETGRFDEGSGAYAYVIDGASDAVLPALATLLQGGARVRVAQQSFVAAGRRFGRGSLLMRRLENDETLAGLLRAVAAEGVVVHTASTARSPDDTPDLGGGEFTLLTRPRVAMPVGDSLDENALGETWHLLDRELGVSVSLIPAGGWVDLRAYNAIVLAPGAGNAFSADALKSWMESGGTLIAIGDAVGSFAAEGGVSAVRRREDVLDDLLEYETAVALERAAGSRPAYVDDLWDNPSEAPPNFPAAERPESSLEGVELDRYRRRFAPNGVIARADLDSTHWVAFGAGLPSESAAAVFVQGPRVLLAKPPVQTPARFASRDRLRLSGLLWPEAAERLADSAYVTVERVGSGQLILFAHRPNFRGAWKGTSRMLANAILLGPGCGASAPAP